MFYLHYTKLQIYYHTKQYGLGNNNAAQLADPNSRIMAVILCCTYSTLLLFALLGFVMLSKRNLLKADLTTFLINL